MFLSLHFFLLSINLTKHCFQESIFCLITCAVVNCISCLTFSVCFNIVNVRLECSSIELSNRPKVSSSSYRTPIADSNRAITKQKRPVSTHEVVCSHHQRKVEDSPMVYQNLHTIAANCLSWLCHTYFVLYNSKWRGSRLRIWHFLFQTPPS